MRRLGNQDLYCFPLFLLYLNGSLFEPMESSNSKMVDPKKLRNSVADDILMYIIFSEKKINCRLLQMWFALTELSCLDRNY